MRCLAWLGHWGQKQDVDNGNIEDRYRWPTPVFRLFAARRLAVYGTLGTEADARFGMVGTLGTEEVLEVVGEAV